MPLSNVSKELLALLASSPTVRACPKGTTGMYTLTRLGAEEYPESVINELEEGGYIDRKDDGCLVVSDRRRALILDDIPGGWLGKNSS